MRLWTPEELSTVAARLVSLMHQAGSERDTVEWWSHGLRLLSKLPAAELLAAVPQLVSRLVVHESSRSLPAAGLELQERQQQKAAGLLGALASADLVEVLRGISPRVETTDEFTQVSGQCLCAVLMRHLVQQCNNHTAWRLQRTIAIRSSVTL